MNQTSVINADNSADSVLKELPGVKRSMTLSREVLRWLQSLDLAYSIKNTKRDFCNGFLIAEIFSRYYDKDIHMHSYDNGTGVKVRRDNWMQLSKFFKKKNLQHIVNNEEINSIINCEDNAVVIFINRIYEVLTHRRVQEVIKRPLPDNLPPYARTTSSYLVSQTAKSLEHQDIEDDLTKSLKLQETMENHEQQLQDDRQENVDRFLSTQQKPIDPPKHLDIAVPTVTVKDIQVKQIDTNAAQLRATRELGNSNLLASSQTSSSLPEKPQTQTTPVTPKPVEPTPVVALNGTEEEPQPLKNPDIISYLNETIAKITSTDEKDAWDKNRDLCWSFVNGIVEQSISKERGLELLNSLSEHCTEMVITFASLPKEFWKCFDVLQSLVFEVTDGSELQIASTNFLITLGKEMLSEDPTIAAALASDYLFIKIPTALRTRSYIKIHNFLKIMYSFIGNDATSHIYTLKKIQTSLNNNNLFLQTLNNIIYLEDEFNEPLIDMYLYYSIMGLGNSSPYIRAASISMISVLASKNFESVVELLPQLMNLGEEDKFWEVQAQLLIAAASILTEVGEWIDYPGIVEKVLSIISSCFSERANLNVRKIGLSVLACHIKNANSLENLFLSVLQGLTSTDRGCILGLEDGELSIPLLGPSNGLFIVDIIPNGWESSEITQIISQEIKTKNLETLENSQVQIIASCVKNSTSLGQQFVEYFENIKDYIYVALCDAENCNQAIEILKCYMYKSSLQESILTESQFKSILNLLYPKSEEGDATCQNLLENFLIECIKGGGNHAVAVEEIYTTLSTAESEQYGSTTLVQRLSEII